jgi:hypothetical protein
MSSDNSVIPIAGGLLAGCSLVFKALIGVAGVETAVQGSRMVVESAMVMSTATAARDAGMVTAAFRTFDAGSGLHVTPKITSVPELPLAPSASYDLALNPNAFADTLLPKITGVPELPLAPVSHDLALNRNVIFETVTDLESIRNPHQFKTQVDDASNNGGSDGKAHVGHAPHIGHHESHTAHQDGHAAHHVFHVIEHVAHEVADAVNQNHDNRDRNVDDRGNWLGQPLSYTWPNDLSMSEQSERPSYLLIRPQNVRSEWVARGKN